MICVSVLSTAKEGVACKQHEGSLAVSPRKPFGKARSRYHTNNWACYRQFCENFWATHCAEKLYLT